jgi:hypothetical protein|tara:strand:+ start:78 stop:725 length:648 start_codon:yes stop_codon:yes gene_type:complete
LIERSKIKFSSKLLYRISQDAPSYQAGEIYGRSEGYGRSYKCICIYVQNGLSNHLELFKIISKSIFKIQSNNKRKYPLLVFGFGDTEFLQHEKKYFDFGYVNSWHNANKVAETISRISGTKKVEMAIMPELFPKTDIRSLYYGKTKIEPDDLLIIIGKKDEVSLDENLKKKNSHRINKLKKRTLLVEILTKNVCFNYKPMELFLNNNSIRNTKNE